MSGYAVDSATGALTPVPSSPFSAGQGPGSVRSGPHLAGLFTFRVETVRVCNHPRERFVNTGLGSPFATGAQPSRASVDPTSRFAYVDNEGSSTISGYAINATTGAFSSIGTFQAPGGAVIILHWTQARRYLYVPGGGSNHLLGYVIDPTTGSLTPLGTFPTGTEPIAVAITAGPLPVQTTTCSDPYHLADSRFPQKTGWDHSRSIPLRLVAGPLAPAARGSR